MQLNQLILSFIGLFLMINISNGADYIGEVDKPTIIIAGDTIELEITGGIARRCGETCFDVNVKNFVNVSTMQFSINWDPRMLDFVQIIQRVSSTDLNTFQISKNINVQRSKGVLRCTWTDPSIQDNTLPDGTTLFSLCFKAVGPAGEKTSIRFTDIPLLIEFTNADGDEYPYVLTGHDILIDDAVNLCVQASACPTKNNNGSITVTVDGGILDYTVTCAEVPPARIINTQGGSTTFSNLAPGDYNFTVSDGTGTKDSIFKMTIKAVDPVKISLRSISWPSCNYVEGTGTKGGHININIEGGTGNPDSFAINWQPGNFFGTNYIGSLAPNIYTVTVIDSLGCESTMSFDMTKRFPKLEANVIKASSCANSLDGIVEAKTIDGKRFPGNKYIYKWSKEGADCDTCQNSTHRKIYGNDQWVIVTDAEGCMDTVHFDVPFDNELLLNFSSLINVTCPGDTDGSFTATALNNNTGVGLYSFNMTDINLIPVLGGVVMKNIYDHQNLAAGQYILTVTHDNGCITFDTIVIGSPAIITMTIDADSTTSCSGGYDGYIDVTAGGGNGGAYTYEWATGEKTKKIDKLEPGKYTVTITDNKGCKVERTFEVKGAESPEINGFTNTEHVKCKGDNTGKTRVNTTEGNSKIIKYTWSNGADTEQVTDLKAGKYFVTIEDENGCTDIDSIEITEPSDALELENFTIINPSCPGAIDGRIALTIKGGSAPYAYVWSDGSTGSILNNIKAGKYSVTISDATDICPPVVQKFNLVDPPHIDIMLIDSSIVSCNNTTTCDAIWEATASGGKDPTMLYDFIWLSGRDRNTDRSRKTDLCQGRQMLIVTNSNCSDTVFFDVKAPEKIKVTETAFTQDVTCFGDSNGVARLEFSGGKGPYDVIWEEGTTQNPNRDDLKARTYHLFIRDANGCLVKDSLVINQPDVFNVLTIDNFVKNPRCNGLDDGRIAIKYEGGNQGKHTVLWSPNGATDSLIQNLKAGTYSVLAKDSKGCEDTLTVTLTEPPIINFEMPLPDPPNCFGEQVPLTVISADGGAGPNYSFTVNTGAKYDINESVDLFAGTYLISVFDKNGCSRDSSIEITSPEEILVEFNEDQIEVELGDSIEICISSDLEPGDTVIWSPEAKKLNADGSCVLINTTDNITYTVTIQNLNGCTETGELRVRIVNKGRVYLPNTFSPNGAGTNNKFRVYTGLGVEKIDYMKVYNRWGGLVYHQENLEPEVDGWNGQTNNNGKKLPAGVYVYLIQVTYKNGDVQLFRSDITLLW